MPTQHDRVTNTPGARPASARRAALKRCPQFLAHWLAATVFVARHALDQAERDVDLGLAVAGVESPEAAPYSTVALHWLKGLLRNVAGDADRAIVLFDKSPCRVQA